MNKLIKNILLDCDGVLYPLNELSTKEIVEAMKQIYRNNVGLTPQEQQFVSEKTISENHLGMFNYINEICRYKNYDFDKFCKDMANIIDYGKIAENKELWSSLQKASEQYNVGVLTNNSRAHLDKVFQQVFSKNVDQVEENGIKAYDIKFMEHGGYFRPKQDTLGLTMFLQKQGFKPQETILFDDTLRNIQKAKEAGMKAVLISQENSLIKELNKLSIKNSRISKIYE